MQKEQQEDNALVRKIVQQTVETEKQIRHNQILYNTRILMEHYIEMKKHCDNAISEEDEIQGMEYDALKGTGAHLESVRRSKMKTAMMICNIDRAMEELREEYAGKKMLYKYEAFHAHYIDGSSYEEVAAEQNCGKNTPARWSKELLRRMSVKLFGVDGIEKW